MSSVFADTTYDANIVLPAELTVGVSYNLSTNTILALDVNRTFWSDYKNLDVRFDGAAPPSLNPRNYEDANIYRIGAQHNVGGGLTVRLGAYFDQSPIKDGYFAPETPRNDAIGFTAGGSYQVSKRLAVDVSFLYLRFDEFKGSYDFVGHDEDPSTSDSSFAGEYKSSVLAGGFGLNYKY
ncbi:MAG TPA: hypothetical protein ENK06_02705 [Gammaproteobacteria bacterium]|nr:hypothetical protein [Gammaproteobacteria bacterium]